MQVCLGTGDSPPITVLTPYRIGWVDINLTVTPTTIPLLFNLLSDPSLSIRMASAGALRRIVSKGLKEPADKLQLIKVLSLGQVIDSLEKRTRAEQIARGDDTDEGEESYREALGRLLNVLGVELIKLADVSHLISKFGTHWPDPTPRTLPLMRFERKVPVYCNRSSPSCSDSWRMNTTIHVRRCSPCCKPSLPVYVTTFLSFIAHANLQIVQAEPKTFDRTS